MRPGDAVLLTPSISTSLPRAKRTFCPPVGFTEPRHSTELRFIKRARSVTHLESTLLKVLILNNLNLFRMNTYKKQGKRPLLAQFWCNVSPFRMNTCKSVSKQRTLTTFRMNTYEKQGGGGQLLLTRIPAAQRVRFRPQQTLGSFTAGFSLGVRVNFSPRQLLHSRDFEVEFFLVACKGKSLEPFRRIA